MDVKKLGWGIWVAGIILGLIALLLAPFTGVSLICCLPAFIITAIGTCIIYADKLKPQEENHAPGKKTAAC